MFDLSCQRIDSGLNLLVEKFRRQDFVTGLVVHHAILVRPKNIEPVDHIVERNLADGSVDRKGLLLLHRLHFKVGEVCVIPPVLQHDKPLIVPISTEFGSLKVLHVVLLIVCDQEIFVRIRLLLDITELDKIFQSPVDAATETRKVVSNSSAITSLRLSIIARKAHIC